MTDRKYTEAEVEEILTKMAEDGNDLAAAVLELRRRVFKIEQTKDETIPLDVLDIVTYKGSGLSVDDYPYLARSETYKGKTATIEYRVQDPENGWCYGLRFKDGFKWQVPHDRVYR